MEQSFSVIIVSRKRLAIRTVRNRQQTAAYVQNLEKLCVKGGGDKEVWMHFLDVEDHVKHLSKVLT